VDDEMHWSKHLERIKQVITASRLGIISDFDGTLSHFVIEPTQAVITPENAKALDVLAEKIALVALISGRAVADLRGRFERPHVAYYGSHGMDLWDEGSVKLVPTATAWEKPLNKLLTEFGMPTEPGIYVENKGVTASVHYRGSANPTSARSQLYEQLQPLAERYGFQLSEGHGIWEIKPPIDVNKGTALATLITDYRLNGVIFLGDDVTDIDAMDRLSELKKNTEKELRALSVGALFPERNLPRIREHCDITAAGPDDIAALLQWIVDQFTTDGNSMP
jgi:trehalose 6-phosphate phosphatase